MDDVRNGSLSNQALSNEALIAAIALIVTLLTIVGPLVWRYLQRTRLKQDVLFHRESHNLKLFEALSSGVEQLQLAAAAVLSERLVAPIDRDTASEHRVIIRALLAVTKASDRSGRAAGDSLGLSKFIADQIAKRHQLPLLEFDFQNCRLRGAWWPAVKAAKVDFWRADLSAAGLRGADLREAILVEAQLDGSVLVGADLSGARLERASVRGADLSGANLAGARFEGAVYDDQTRWPDGFDPAAMGLTLARDAA